MMMQLQACPLLESMMGIREYLKLVFLGQRSLQNGRMHKICQVLKIKSQWKDQMLLLNSLVNCGNK
jgi:hypothetical protein